MLFVKPIAVESFELRCRAKLQNLAIQSEFDFCSLEHISVVQLFFNVSLSQVA
jgi:hypothetical protein